MSDLPGVSLHGKAAMSRARAPRLRHRAIVVAAALAMAVAAACAPPVPVEQRIALFGDSLIDQSASTLLRRAATDLPGHQLDLHYFPGTAQCDWTAAMEDVARQGVGTVVLAFAGNMFTACARGGDAYARYRADAEWAVEFWRARGVRLVFVAAPGMVGATADDRPAPRAYLDVAAATGTPVIDLGPRFVDPVSNTYTERLACLPTEGPGQGCSAGTIQVRTGWDGLVQDRIHFCLRACTVYSSGVVRYATGIVDGLRDVLTPVTTTTVPSSSTSTSTTSTSTTSTSTTSSSTTSTSTPAPGAG